MLGLLGILLVAVGRSSSAKRERVQRRMNEESAVSTLETIAQSQETLLVRRQHQTLESVAESQGLPPDGVVRYGSLEELRAIVGGLASETQAGYRFECRPHPEEPEFEWMAVANPIDPGRTGDRYFVVDQEGVVHYRRDEPFRLDGSFEIPEDARPLD